ncbi:LysR family transcriptional regulator [Shewanella sp. JM162201]|uniref:LysR family transcriptional regulator n=1 Tax=Shewanella jiangmenensis TaxID=2837387 RepID=A0ABS5UY13_9GAMM|nr:LysR family transcriptional regulator [Shewanella jiangmenensis]MBT1442971.1 LysR family transcriptional regulator [Shewanella jiangmenensis]
MNKPLDKQLAELEIFSLLLFRAIFESGHANIAARQLDVSAPKVSRALASLRAALGDELFYRRQQGLRPTPLAEQIYPAIRELTDSIAGLSQSLKACQDYGQRGPARFEIAISSGLMIALARQLSRREPHSAEVRLHLWQADSADKIHAGELDLGLALTPESHGELNFERILDIGGLNLVGTLSHPIWQLHQPTLEQICEYPFLCMNHPGFNDKVDPLELFCQREGLPPLNVIRLSDKEEWYAQLLTSQCLAFAPPLGMQLLAALPELKREPLPQSELARLHHGIAPPGLYLVEKPIHHRRYNDEFRQQIISLISAC